MHVRKNFEAIMGGAAIDLDLGRFQNSISGLFDFLKQSTCGNVLLSKLETFDNYLMSHSTNVCYLALLLGMKLERYLIEERYFKSAREAKDLQLLGLGCLLHDVGKMRVPAEILHSPRRLDAAQMEIMRQHPVYGHEMVKGRVPPAVAQVVLNHHQQYGGKGYPERVDNRTGEQMGPMKGKQIPVFSRIATVVDVYDAATSTRVYQPAKLPVQALFEMPPPAPDTSIPKSSGRSTRLSPLPDRPDRHAVQWRRGGGRRFQFQASRAAQGAGTAVPTGDAIPTREWKSSIWPCIPTWRSPRSTASTCGGSRLRVRRGQGGLAGHGVRRGRLEAEVRSPRVGKGPPRAALPFCRRG